MGISQKKRLTFEDLKNQRVDFIEKNNVSTETKSILEIGVLDKPTFTKKEKNIFYLDWFSREELYFKHKEKNLAIAKGLYDVDFVVKNKDFSNEINDKFDIVIANHIIEHVPDTINWLQNISSILNEDGFLFLAIPDKNYTFDKLRSLTTLARLICNNDEKLVNPTVYHVFEHLNMGRQIKAKDVWTYKYERILGEKKINSSDALSFAKSQVEKLGYVDVHCHIFDAQTFPVLVEELNSMEYIDLFIEDVREVIYLGNEFLVALKKKV